MTTATRQPLTDSLHAAFEQQRVLKGIFLAMLLALVYYAFWVQTFDGPPRVYQRACKALGLGSTGKSGTMSTSVWLQTHWRNVSHYSHGPLIPLIALGLVWWKRNELLRLRLQPCVWGNAVLAGAMFCYYAGIKANQPHLSVMGFIGTLYGVVLALGGRDIAKVLFFPIAFLLLMIPLNFLDERVALPLRHLMVSTSVASLQAIGVEVWKQGTAICSRAFHPLDVAQPCSGIQSLMALTTVTAAYAYVTQRSQWKRWVLFLSAMPLAVLGNYTRVVGIVLVAQKYGEKTALALHDSIAGFLVFGVALSAMVGVGWLLNPPYRLWFRRRQPSTPTGTPA